MILIIDNYDSFTYNIYQFVGEIYPHILVKRNDEITLEEIEALQPEAILISPGPGYPAQAGITLEVIKRFYTKVPMLGVCLGHQAVVEAFGGKIIPAKTLMHGKRCDIQISSKNSIFKGLPDTIQVGRYHSLAVDDGSIPGCLEIMALAEDKEIMAVKHKEYPVYGLQFHPESVLTQFGRRILKNFIAEVSRIPITMEESQELADSEKNMLKPFIQKVIDSEDLSEQDASEAMNIIMDGLATDAQIGSFMTALRMKGETIEEITGFAKTMRSKAVPLPPMADALDIVGTGGDLARTFNISTTASFVAAAAGARVAKHGNRSVSSLSGAADVLDSLGVKIALSPEETKLCMDEAGVCFMFAPSFHKSMRFAASPRKEIGVRSVFNILGPLANPAAAEYMLMGVYGEELLEPLGRVLMNLGVKKALIVHGDDGLDEVTVCDSTSICEINQGKLTRYRIAPEDFGMKRAGKESVVGSSPEENAEITKRILGGEKGPKRDIVVLNAAAALYASNRCNSLKEGIAMAEKAIDEGAAIDKLNQLVELTRSL